MNFPFPSLKLLNKGIKECSKIIIFINFHSILFSIPKREFILGQSRIFILYRKKWKKKKKKEEVAYELSKKMTLKLKLYYNEEKENYGFWNTYVVTLEKKS